MAYLIGNDARGLRWHEWS